jgi:transmembrane sensor
MLRDEVEWSAGDQAGLEAWLAQSMAHKAAYWRLEHGWREADRIAALGDMPELTTRVGWFPRATWWRPVAIAASLLLAIGLGALYVMPGLVDPAPEASAPAAAPTRFATRVGGRKTVTLSDGSRVELNTATSVRARVTLARREFWLDSGEAYFEVAHAPNLPFVIHAGQRDITVLGTKFSVRRDGDRVRVSVVEGRVRIDQASGSQGPRSSTVTGGDVVVAEGPSTLVASNAGERVRRQLSWRQGMLTFDQATLAEAAAEFNRYNPRQLVVADPETASIRIGGSFQSNNIDAFVRLLREAYGLRVEVRGEQTRISG